MRIELTKENKRKAAFRRKKKKKERREIEKKYLLEMLPKGKKAKKCSQSDDEPQLNSVDGENYLGEKKVFEPVSERK